MTLYALDGHWPEGKPLPPGQALYGYPVLGKVDVPDAATRRRLALAFADAVSRPVVPNNCFWPRHALRVVRGGATTDRLICFECHNYDRWVNGERDFDLTQPIAPSARPAFDAVLSAAGVPVAPEH